MDDITEKIRAEQKAIEDVQNEMCGAQRHFSQLRTVLYKDTPILQCESCVEFPEPPPGVVCDSDFSELIWLTNCGHVVCTDCVIWGRGFCPVATCGQCLDDCNRKRFIP